MSNAYLPYQAEVLKQVPEGSSMVTLGLRLTDPAQRQRYRFHPGQFNMLYVYGVGEVAISLSSDPDQLDTLEHTIRAVGRVTRVLSAIEPGSRLGLRGPYGKGWPLDQVEGRDIVVLTGGLGCAPVVSVINYILQRRERFRRLVEAQGGDPGVADDPSLLPSAPEQRVVSADRSGTVTSVRPRVLGEGVVRLGGGRRRVEDDIDPSVGFELRVRPGDALSAGDALGVVHARAPEDGQEGAAILRSAVVLDGDASVGLRPLLSHRVDVEGTRLLHEPD